MPPAGFIDGCWRWGRAGFIAVLAGWITTEVGRQPFTVYGLLRTATRCRRSAPLAWASSLAAFVVVYFLVFGAGVFYILKLMSKPPKHSDPGVKRGKPIRAAGIALAPAFETRPVGRAHPGGE